MENLIDRQKISRAILVLIPFSLFFSERMCTFLIIAYAVAVLLQGSIKNRFTQAFKTPWVFPFLILFLIHALTLLWSEDFQTGWLVVEKKTSLLVLPMLIAADGQMNRKTLDHVLFSLILGCFIALWICFGIAFWQFAQSGDSAVFFYHSLSWPLDEFNAIYFSLFIFVSLVSLNFLAASHPLLSNKWTQSFIAITFIGGILLLSSRLFILLTIGYLGFLIYRHVKARMSVNQTVFVWSLGLIAILGGVLMSGYTWKRFDHILQSQFEVVRQDQFQWYTPFNGLTLRMVFLKFGWEILSENNAVISGVGVGDSQHQMDAMIKRSNLYHGNPTIGDTGYLGYNFHNQYMEFWVQAGLFGVLAWLWVLFQGWRQGMQVGWNYPLIFLILAVTLFALTEGLMERQRGVVFTVLFLSILHVVGRE